MTLLILPLISHNRGSSTPSNLPPSWPGWTHGWERREFFSRFYFWEEIENPSSNGIWQFCILCEAIIWIKILLISMRSLLDFKVSRNWKVICDFQGNPRRQICSPEVLGDFLENHISSRLSCLTLPYILSHFLTRFPSVFYCTQIWTAVSAVPMEEKDKSLFKTLLDTSLLFQVVHLSIGHSFRNLYWKIQILEPLKQTQKSLKCLKMCEEIVSRDWLA